MDTDRRRLTAADLVCFNCAQRIEYEAYGNAKPLLGFDVAFLSGLARFSPRERKNKHSSHTRNSHRFRDACKGSKPGHD